MYRQQKANIVLEHLTHLGEKHLARPTILSAFLLEKACAWTTKNNYHFRSCNILTHKRNKDIQTIDDFNVGKQALLLNNCVETCGEFS